MWFMWNWRGTKFAKSQGLSQICKQVGGRQRKRGESQKVNQCKKMTRLRQEMKKEENEGQ